MRVFSYSLGLLIGVLSVVYLFPWVTIAGTGGLWAKPFNVDLMQNLTGHLVFQRPGWHWPLLYTPDLFWPHGASIAMTDSNPLFSLIAKVIAGWRGAPVNLLGAWFACCYLLQPVAGVYAVRGFGARRWEAALAAATFAACCPAFLFRIAHINLCGHFMILLALGQAARMILGRRGTQPADWGAAFAILFAAIIMHPTLFLIAAAVLVSPALQAVIEKQPHRWRAAAYFLVAALLSFVPFQVLSGMTGGMDRGFGVYSMNLLSPVWPQASGLFGPQLPLIDATNGQYEGFNYLGGGGLLLILVAIFVGWRFGPPDWRRWRGLTIVLGGLTLLALSSQIYAGHLLLVPLGTRQWDQVFGFVRSSGRLFWPVGYTLVFGAIVLICARLRRLQAGGVLLVAAMLQFIDARPLRDDALSYFSGGGPEVARLDLPAGVKLLTTLPVCTRTDDGGTISAALRLDAARAGARLSDIKLSRLPVWFNCERSLTDGMELPLLPGEMRVLMEPVAIERLRRGVFGSAAACRRYGAAVMCARDDVALTGGMAFDIAQPIPPLAVPANLEGAAVGSILSFGWQPDPDGLSFWSEGPRVTLLAKLPANPPSASLQLHLTVEGIARKLGDDRPVVVQIGAGKPIAVALGDRKLTEIVLPVPAATLSDGILRVAIDIFRPIDPKRRAIAAPVDRAGVRLEKVELTE